MELQDSLIEKPNADSQTMEFGMNWTAGNTLHRIVFSLLVLISGRVSLCHPLRYLTVLSAVEHPNTI